MALLVVLMLVAIMTAVAVGVMDDIRFAQHRTANSTAMSQARWYAIAAESFAGLQLQRLRQVSPERTTLQGCWQGRETRYPMEGGEIRIRVSDGGNCFNLNTLRTSVLTSEAPAGAPSIPRRRFIALLSAINAGADSPEDLADAISDWIDFDQQRTGSGWEDDAYQRLAIPYRTAGGPMVERTELRAVAGVSPDVYDALRPFVCVLPQAGENLLNINTLTEEQAPLLAAFLFGAITPSAARDLIARRPEAGWPSLDAFWADGAVAALGKDPQLRLAIAAKTRYFLLETRVEFLDAEMIATALLEQMEDTAVITRLRRWAPEE